MIYPHQNKRKLLYGQDVCDISVLDKRYDEAIDQAPNDNKIEDSY